MARYPPISNMPVPTDERGEKLCRNCFRPIHSGRRKYCSDRCMHEFLRNHTWHFVRKDVLKRDNYTCSICRKRFPKRKLEIDHIIPVRAGGNPFDKKNLRTLCRECHRKKTKMEKEIFNSSQIRR